MASTSVNYRTLDCTANATAYDSENEKTCGSSYASSRAHSISPSSIRSSEFSSAYVSPDVSPYLELDLERLHIDSHSNAFDSIDISNIRVVKPPSDPWDNDSVLTSNEDSLKTSNSQYSHGNNSHVFLSNSTNIDTFSTYFSDFTYSMLSMELPICK